MAPFLGLVSELSWTDTLYPSGDSFFNELSWVLGADIHADPGGGLRLGILALAGLDLLSNPGDAWLGTDTLSAVVFVTKAGLSLDIDLAEGLALRLGARWSAVFLSDTDIFHSILGELGLRFLL